jgi:virulence-associated protein VagC
MRLAKRLAEYRVKLFRHGGSQAARLPKELRIEAREAVGFRKGDLVILRPVGEDFIAPKPLPPTPRRDSVLEDL